MTNKRVLITGGAGFIGSHLVEGWLQKGAEVIVLDNLRSGNYDNIKDFNTTFINGSITDKQLVEEITEGIDYIHNLAALVSVPESVYNPIECVNINVIGLLNILEAAKKNNVKKVIHFSSAAVYGENPQSPKHTRLTPDPRTPYGITKLDGEYYLNFYREAFGLDTLSFRCFNVYGPRQNPESQYAAAVPIFIYKSLANKEITIYGDGEQTRDFIYVKDIVKANIKAAEMPNLNGVFNLGTGESISINDLVKIVLEVTNSKSEVIYQPERAGDIRFSLADINDTQKAIQIYDYYTLKEGLTETIKALSK